MISAVLGIGIICALLLAIMFNLDDNKHLILKLIMLFFVFATMLLIPKAVIDNQTVCEVMVNDTFLEVNGTGPSGEQRTFYEYGLYCFDRVETTGQTLFGITTTMYYLFVGYAIVFLGILSMIKLYESVKGGRK